MFCIGINWLRIIFFFKLDVLKVCSVLVKFFLDKFIICFLLYKNFIVLERVYGRMDFVRGICCYLLKDNLLVVVLWLCLVVFEDFIEKGRVVE